MLQEAKAKFFDLQRVIEQKQAELNGLVELRVNLVKEIEKLEADPTGCCDEGEDCLSDTITG
jgi:cell division protein FtsB